MGKKAKTLKFEDLPEHKKHLWLVANNVTRNDILSLSKQDYGQDSDRHAESMTYFKQTLDTSKLDSWYPMEVWELNRWSSPGYLDTVGHARRAFSCSGIMAYYFDGLGEPVDTLDILLPLFESSVRLDLPDWQRHLSNFLSYGSTKTKYVEDKFILQLVRFLARHSESTDLAELRSAYDQLMLNEMSMLKHQWENHWNETWDPALEPQIERPAMIVETNITHGTAYLFSAKYVYQKAEQINDAELSEDLKTLARRIAWLGHDNIDEFLPTSTLHL